MISTRIAEMRLAVMMLTRVPVGRLDDPVPTLGAAAWAFPLVGLLVGAIGWLGFALALWLGLAPLTSALMSMASAALATGALHYDGLADFADGIGGGRDRDHSLEIMRDSRIGSYGVVALTFAITLQASALSQVTTQATIALFLTVGVASRFAMVVLLIWMPPARAEGLGASAHVTSAMSLAPGFLVLIPLCHALGWQSVVLLTLMGLGVVGVAVLALRRIKGQTGDVIGAAQLTSETLGWIAVSSAAFQQA